MERHSDWQDKQYTFKCENCKDLLIFWPEELGIDNFDDLMNCTLKCGWCGKDSMKMIIIYNGVRGL